MKDETLDPRMEKLVAALYGELTGEEQKEIDRLLAEDPKLRKEWEELRSTHDMLGALESEETAPSFVFLTEEEPAVRVQAAPVTVWSRIRGVLDHLGAAPAWGLAAAALLALVLGLNDFRIQKVDGGFAFRFGDGPAAVDPVVPMPQGTLASNDPLLTRQNGTGVQAIPVSAGYLTRQDLDDYESQMLRLMGAMIKDYGQYRDQELGGIIRTMYSEMNVRQEQAYGDLRDRIDAVNVGLMLQNTESNARFRQLLGDGTEQEEVPPVTMEDDRQ